MKNNNDDKLERFIHILCGQFSNKEQVVKDPKCFAHINIYIRELPYNLFNSKSVYSEQSFNHDPWSPYRQSVQKIYIEGKTFILENYQLKNSVRVAGAGFNQDLLKEIDKDKLIIKKGCNMHFRKSGQELYIGHVEQGNKCLLERNGKVTYLKSNVEIGRNHWISIDEGYDIKENKKVWGSNNGALKFKRVI